MATIRKRGELQWQAIVKRKGVGFTSKTFLTKKDAEDWAKIKESEMIRGHFINNRDAEKTTLGELIERYRADVLPTKRGNGFSPALNALDAAFGRLALSAITSKRVAGYRDKRLKERSPDTARKEINLLSKLIDLAGKEWGITIPINPCKMVSRPAAGKARDRRLEGDELKRLLSASKPHMASIIEFGVETAARLGELLSVKWADVDLKRRVMVIRGIDDRGTKNDDAYRAVPLSSRAVETLRNLKTMPRSIDGRVFYWWKASDSFNKSWRRVCKRAGVEGLRFHDLRHEATSRLFEKGVFDSMEVASITGHKTLAMLKRYTHLRAEDLAKKMP